MTDRQLLTVIQVIRSTTCLWAQWATKLLASLTSLTKRTNFSVLTPLEMSRKRPKTILLAVLLIKGYKFAKYMVTTWASWILMANDILILEK